MRRVAPDPVRDPHGFSAVAHSHPRWVVDALGEALARSPRTEVATTTADELQALLAADNEAPAVCLVARPGRVDRAELPGTPTPLSPYGVVLDGGDPGEVPAVAQGRAGVQDEGSQLVAVALSRAGLEPGPAEGEERWLDLCAGPGGKSALLAALAATRVDEGASAARLLSVERQQHRARLVRRALGRRRTARSGWSPPTAPCRPGVRAPSTGSRSTCRAPASARCAGGPSRAGVAAPTDLETLVPLQRALLARAVDAVRPGGVVLYSTCSPVLAETADVVSSVLAERDDVRLGDLAPLLPEVHRRAGPLPGTVQLWPHRHRTDAMFMALLERTS